MEKRIEEYLRDCEDTARMARLFLARTAKIGDLRKVAKKTASVLHDERIEENGHWSGYYYRQQPCGCCHYETVLSDGSLGWGEWSEYCSYHAYDEDGNLK